MTLKLPRWTIISREEWEENGKRYWSVRADLIGETFSEWMQRLDRYLDELDARRLSRKERIIK